MPEQQCSVSDEVIQLIYEKLKVLRTCMSSLQTTANGCARYVCKHLKITNCPQSKVTFYTPTLTRVRQVVCPMSVQNVSALIFQINQLTMQCSRTTVLTRAFVEYACRFIRCSGNFPNV